jgi:uncharacterized protein (DUF433 family)
MTPALSYPHLKTDSQGRMHIGDSRYTVEHLAGEHYFLGWTAEELLRQHPDLRPEEVYAALTYFYDHHVEVLARLNLTADDAEQRRAGQTLSRAELMQRKLPGTE